MRRFFNQLFGQKSKPACQSKSKRTNQPVLLAVESLEERVVPFVPIGGGAVWSFATLSYSYSNLLDGGLMGLSTDELLVATREAMGVWAAVTPLTFTEAPDSGPSPAGISGAERTHSSADYDPIQFGQLLRWGHHNIDGSTGSTAAHAFPPGDTGLAGDMHFDDSGTFTSGLFLEVAAHEFGHALGLAHSDKDGSFIMHSTDLHGMTGPGTAFLFQDDINGVRSLYGTGLGYVLGIGGDLHVYGTGDDPAGNGGDNLITVNTSGGNITVFSQGNGTFTRSLAGIRSIHIHGQSGDDIIRIESNAGLPTFLHGDAGNDTFDFSLANGNLGLITGPTRVFGDAGNDRVFLYDNNNPSATTYTVNSFVVGRPGFGGIVLHEDADSQITLWAGRGVDTVNVLSTQVGTPVFINNAGGRDTVNIGHSSLGVQDIRAEVQVQNDPSYTTLNINDTGNHDNARVAAFDINGRFGYLAGMAPAIISWDTFDIAEINLTTGEQADDLYVLRNSEVLNLNSTGGEDNVFLGTNEGSLQDITGEVTIRNSPWYTRLLVNDSADATFRGATLDTVVLADGIFGLIEVEGLAAPIRYKYADTRHLTVLTGRGGAVVNVRATGVPTTLTGHGPNTTVNVGNTGLLDGIQGELTVNNPSSFTFLDVYGGSESAFRTVTLDTVLVDGAAHGRFLIQGSAPIRFKYADTREVVLRSSSGGAAVNVLAAGVPTHIGSFANNTTVHVGNAGRLEDITRTVRVFGSGSVALTVDDSNNPVGRPNMEITTSQITGFGPLATAAIDYDNATLRSLTVRGGAGADVFNVRSTPAGTPVTLSPGLGDDTVNVGGLDNRLDGIQGALTILDGTDGTLPVGLDHNVITLHDEGNATAGFDYTMNDVALTRAGIAPINLGPCHYDQIEVHPAGGDSHVTFAGAPGYYTWTYWYAGAGNDRVDVLATPFGAFLDIFDDGGNDVFRAGSASQGPGDVAPHGGTVENIGDGQVYFSDYGGTARVVLDNSGGTTPQTVTVFPNGAWGLNDHNLAFYYTGTPATIYGGSGGNTFSLQQYGGVGTPLEIYAGSGNDTLNFDQPHTYPFWYHSFGFHGQGGIDTLNINDQSATDTPTWDISPSAIIRTAPLELYGWDKVVTMPISGLENVNINGGSGHDTFQINATAFAPAIRIDGGAGVNTLDYAAVTQGVVVNLPLGTATGLTGGIAGFQNVVGGAGNDVLVGNAVANALRGGDGRDLLIGGLGADTIDGGADDDIVIGGYTAYDSNPTALVAIMSEWTRTDLDVLGAQGSYKARIDHLMSRSGLNGTYALKSSKGQGTVFDDGFADVLDGGDGLDWFFGEKKQDTITSVPPEKVS